jgi:hypothetical protein
MFLECGRLSYEVNNRLCAPDVMRGRLYRDQNQVCRKNDGTGDCVDLGWCVNNHVIVVRGVGRNFTVQLVGW